MKIKEKTIPASEFKAKCLKILDHLGSQGVVVTKRGRPVAKVMPAGEPDNSALIGLMKGKVVVRGDIFSTGRKWHAQSRHARAHLAVDR
jgi:prevent-host-death family protein